jgi:hypothetical protein
LGTKTAMSLDLPNFEDISPCEVCGTEINVRNKHYTTNGVAYCLWCLYRNGPNNAIMVAFVKQLAGMECFNNHDIFENPYCDLDCKCISCTARKILKARRRSQ